MTNKFLVPKILFGRTVIVVALMILQLLLFFSIYQWFFDIVYYFVGGFALLSAFLVVTIINSKSNPAFKLAWILPVLVIPVFGGFLYLAVERNLGGRTFHKKVQLTLDKTSGFLKTSPPVLEDLQEKPLKNLAHYVENTSGFPIYQNTTISYFPLGEHKFAEMKKQLSKAERFIFLEYFIVDEGKMWGELLEILIEKAKQGVEVRVMYDGMGTMLTLPSNYDDFLTEQGIKAKIFSPIIPLISTHQNNRDHRKILVIDGKIAFNGGVNLADEYINEKVVYGHWKDVAILLDGEAVKSFTLMFLQMWNIEDQVDDDFEIYLKSEVYPKKTGFIMPYCDNPLTHDRVGETVYMDIINKAQQYLYIMTPYLIIDNELLTALTVASKSGVDVKIMMPHIPDKKLPFDIARTFYPILMEAGIEIYEYTEGFIHGKMFVCDGKKAVVGTVNLDYRSLYHHFECATYMEDVPEISEMESDFQTTLKRCQLMTFDKFRALPVSRRLRGRIFRLLAPLM